MKRCLPMLLVMMAARVGEAQYSGAGSLPAVPPGPSTLPSSTLSYPRLPSSSSPSYARPSDRLVARTDAPSMVSTVVPAHAEMGQSVDMRDDGKCKLVKAGDVVHYQLTILAAEMAPSVYANLQLRRHGGLTPHSELPFPDALGMGGRGMATRDAQSGNVYHVAFTVQPDVPSGLYRGTGVLVTLGGDAGNERRPQYVEVTKHTRKEIQHYCLAVAGPYGGPVGAGRPLVTDFKPGPIERK